MIILPNSADDRFVFGLFRFTRLKRLKNSDRNSRLWLSLYGMTNFLKAEKSTFASPGPRSVFLPSVPNVPGALMTNASVLNQRATCSPLDRSPGSAGLPMMSARSSPMPLKELSIPGADRHRPAGLQADDAVRLPAAEDVAHQRLAGLRMAMHS